MNEDLVEILEQETVELDLKKISLPTKLIFSEIPEATVTFGRYNDNKNFYYVSIDIDNANWAHKKWEPTPNGKRRVKKMYKTLVNNLKKGKYKFEVSAMSKFDSDFGFSTPK